MLHRCIAVAVAAAAIAGCASLPADHGGVVSASHPLAAAAGARMLERGGNAIDAAAAMQFALNVVEPQYSGIGGGAVMLIHLPKGRVTLVIDARERAPAAASADMFAPGGRPMSFADASTSGVSVGVPGTLLGFEVALNRWGTMTLAETLQPAIALAEDGFAVNRFLAAAAANPRSAAQPETAAIFHPNGTPLAEGDLLKQPDLAKTFRLLAEQGSAAFYRGPIARAIVQAQRRSRTPVAEHGAGRITEADLASYEVAIREPIAARYRGYTLASMGPPSSGALSLLQMLHMLRRFPLGDASRGFGFGATKTWHAMIESMRMAHADRATWIGDEDFVHVPVDELLNPAYLDARSGAIDLGSRMRSPVAGNVLRFDTDASSSAASEVVAKVVEPERVGHTTHFSVVDRDGNIVSATSTIEATWGSGITVPGWGFLLNNELTDFNFVPARSASPFNPGANDVEPNKRPRSSMTPTILFRGDAPIAAYGSPGGTTIVNSVLNVTLNLIDHRMTIQQAIDAPRLSVTGALGTVSCESGEPFMAPAVPAATIAELKALGHFSNASSGALECAATVGSVQAVVIDLATGARAGGADKRREGTVIAVPPRGKE